MEGSQWENCNHLICRKVSFLTGHHCQFWGLCQDMKQTYLRLWYPLSKALWDRCDQRNHQTIHLYSEREIKALGSLLFVLLEKPLFKVCLVRIKEQVGDRRSTVCTHRYADCLLKNMSTNKFLDYSKSHLGDMTIIDTNKIIPTALTPPVLKTTGNTVWSLGKSSGH